MNPWCSPSRMRSDNHARSRPSTRSARKRRFGDRDPLRARPAGGERGRRAGGTGLFGWLSRPMVPPREAATWPLRRRMETHVKRPLLTLGAACCATLGCAHHKANQYSYAPPLAPAVYPQPQQSMQPVAFPAPATLPPGAVVAPGAAAPPMMPSSASADVVPAMADGACPTGCDGTPGAVPVAYESAVQTPPCPQGP